MSDVSRRDFLKLLGTGTLGLIAGPGLAHALKRGSPPRRFASDVVQCYDDDATSGSAVNEPVVQVMMDESIKALTGINDVGEAWKSLFPGITSSSIIAIKVCCASPQCPSRRETANCIVNGLVRMNISGSNFKKNNVVIWERTNSELTAAGYTLYTGNDPDTTRCFGSNQSGIGYNSSTPLVVNGVTSYPSRILSGISNFVISLPVLKTHATTSVTLSLKNHYGSVNNASSLQHSSGARDAIPSLNQQIRDVLVPNGIQRLSVIDGLFGMYSGGPGGSPNFNPKLLLMSRDPVAIDYQGQNVINTERRLHGLGDLAAPHITNAALPPYNLGSTEVNLIQVYNPSAIAERDPALRSTDDIVVTPLPVRDQATVSFTLTDASSVQIELTDAAGRRVQDVFRGRLAAGRHRLALVPAQRLSAGEYFLRLSARGITRVRPVTVLN